MKSARKICINAKKNVPLRDFLIWCIMDLQSLTLKTNFETLCQQRRSIRKYTSEPVTAEQIDYILRCALMSPSSKRTNPWEFYVKTKDLQPLSACKTYGAQMFETAQAAIAVALDSSLTDTWQADGAIAAEHILLAAEDCGLGACWCHIYQREDAEQLAHTVFDIPANLSVLCVISLGHKDEERKPYNAEKLLYNKIHTL